MPLSRGFTLATDHPKSRLDGSRASPETGGMLVFLDLPGDLVREMKRKTAHEGRRLSEVATECLRRGITPGPPPTGEDALPWLHPEADLPEQDMTLGDALHRAKLP